MSADPSLGALDPGCSRVLRAELPGVRDAFDESLMRRHLQASLFEDGGHGYIIGRCERGKAVYVPGEGCAVRYAIEVRHHVGRLVTPALTGFQSYREIVDRRGGHDGVRCGAVAAEEDAHRTVLRHSLRGLADA